MQYNNEPVDVADMHFGGPTTSNQRKHCLQLWPPANPFHHSNATTTTTTTTTSEYYTPPSQVLIVAFHPDKTGGSTIGRFLEVQEQENGGEFEIMPPKNETWLLLWLGDANFRKQHPKVFVHFHNVGQQRFSRRNILKRAREVLTDEMFQLVQPDAVPPPAVHYFEYLVRLLAMQQQRLSKDGDVKILCMPHWREPGDHFVSAVMFLDISVAAFAEKNPKLGALGHTQRVLDLVSNLSWPEEWKDKKEVDKLLKKISPEGANRIIQYYRPELQLRYYFGTSSPIAMPLHHHIINPSSSTNTVSSTTERNTFTFSEAISYLRAFINDTQSVALWAITDLMDQSMLLLSLLAGFSNIYEPGTCLPLWDVLGTNTNKNRKRSQSEDEIIAASISRRSISPGSMALHPLFVQAHMDWWDKDISLLQPHVNAIIQARHQYSNPNSVVDKAVLEKRKSYKLFLQQKRGW